MVCLGHNQPRWVVEGCEEYGKRFGRQWPFTLTELKPERRTEGKPIEPILALEAQRVLQQIPRGAALIALDERGEAVSSRELSTKLSTLAAEYSNACFVIGSADGLDANLRAGAHWRWSLSRLTLPHGLARVFAVEQLYRAVSLAQGLPYHRD
jgi:23S rRNA (pseudouridine1915-N3)-methyltransferase